jgi:hypothetical protein
MLNEQIMEEKSGDSSGYLVSKNHVRQSNCNQLEKSNS